MVSEHGVFWEETKYLSTGEPCLFLHYKNPLKDRENKVIGIIGGVINIQNNRLKTINHQKKFPNVLNKLYNKIYQPLKEMLLLIELIKLTEGLDDIVNLISETKLLIETLSEDCNNFFKLNITE